MNVTEKIVTFRNATKENVDYISGLIGIGGFSVAIAIWLYNNYFTLSITFRILILHILGVLIYFFIRNYKRVIADSKQSLEVARILYTAEYQANQLSTKKLINFQKIIPTTNVLNQIYIQSLKNAQNNLDPQCVHVHSYLDIVFHQTPTGSYKKKFSISVGYKFFSQKKKMTISEWAKDLKLVTRIPTFEYQEQGFSSSPFFENIHWRDALIEACERTEVHLITLNHFSIHLIGYSKNDIYISFSRGVPLSKTYAYSLTDNALYEGIVRHSPIKEYS